MKSLLLTCCLLLALSLPGTAQVYTDTLVTDSGLKYVIVKQGSGAKAAKGSKVKVQYIGRLLDGSIFDTSLDAKPLKLTVGVGEVIPGWDEALQLLARGEKMIVVIPSELAYGARGMRDPENPERYIVPPDTNLIFEIEVLEIK